MGDLDEAIREHLELKRRRGADPAEVARQEQEALSPVTRSHAVVVPFAQARERELAQHDEAAHQADAAEPPHDEDPDHSTQEFRIEHTDWLDDDD
jgi:hypothetical protein